MNPPKEVLKDELGTATPPLHGKAPKGDNHGKGLKAKASTAQYFSFALNYTKRQPLSLLSNWQSQVSLTPCMSQGLTPSGTHTQQRTEPGMNIPVHFPGWTGKSQLRSANSAKEAVDKCLDRAFHKWSSTTSRAELAWFWLAHRVDKEAYSCLCPSV